MGLEILLISPNYYWNYKRGTKTSGFRATDADVELGPLKFKFIPELITILKLINCDVGGGGESMYRNKNFKTKYILLFCRTLLFLPPLGTIQFNRC